MENLKKRKSYTSSFKLAVCKRAEEVGNRSAARENNIDEKCVRRWRSDKDSLIKLPEFKKSRRGGKEAYPDLEAKLEKWLLDEIEEGKLEFVSSENVCEQAKLIAMELDIKRFRGSQKWLNNFMSRKSLTDKISQKQSSNLESGQEYLKCLHQYIKENKISANNIVNIVHFVFMFGGAKLKINNKIITNVSNKNNTFTCILACASDGEKLNPILIFKRKTVPKGNFPQNITIWANETGLMNEYLMIKWLKEIWQKREVVSNCPHGLLILDTNFSAYLSESVRSVCEKLFVKLSVIPNHLTKLLQPLKSITDCFKNQIEIQMKRNVKKSLIKREKIEKNTCEQIANYVSNFWENVNSLTIKSDFTGAKVFPGKYNESSVANDHNYANEF